MESYRGLKTNGGRQHIKNITDLQETEIGTEEVYIPFRSQVMFKKA